MCMLFEAETHKLLHLTEKFLIYIARCLKSPLLKCHFTGVALVDCSWPTDWCFLFLIPSILIQPLNKGQDYMQITAYHLRGLHGMEEST